MVFMIGKYLERYKYRKYLNLKKLSLCHKLWFSNPYISVTQCRRHYIFQTMNPVRLDIQSLKNQTFTLSGCKYIGMRKLKFVAKTQFLSTVK